MPKFDPKKKKGTDVEKPSAPADAFPVIVEPRCHVCTHQYRPVIDRLIAQGTTSYSELERMFNVDRRSFANHAKEHLNYQDAAIRQIVADEASRFEANLEEGIKGVITRRVYLESALQKGLEALLNGDITVEPKDVLAIIEKLDNLDKSVEGAAIDEIQVQFNAFVQAIRETQPPEQWQIILDRTQELLKETPELGPG